MSVMNGRNIVSQLINSCRNKNDINNKDNKSKNKINHTNDDNDVDDGTSSVPFPGMIPGRGRGAPGIDLLEVMYLDEYFTNPVLSTSLQVAPGVPETQRPILGYPPNTSQIWYSPEYGNNVTLNTYFYGTISYPMDQTKKPYRTDSISANYGLNKDFHDNFHTFRIEWEPPDEETGMGGYIQWFIDDQLITAVEGDDLFTTSYAEIPSEPMYLVMNLAVSKDWGFPDAYFKNCPKKCWSCFDSECSCALPKGFCSNLPTSFEIASVRVYQQMMVSGRNNIDVSRSKYTEGCSPPNRPTADYIKANVGLYKAHDEDDTPLKDLIQGGGNCTTHIECGDDDRTRQRRGYCDDMSMQCICSSRWTGPLCHAAAVVYDDEEEEEKKKMFSDEEDDDDDEVIVPFVAVRWGILLVAAVVAIIMVVIVPAWYRFRIVKDDKAMYQRLSNHLSTADQLDGSKDPQERPVNSYQNS